MLTDNNIAVLSGNTGRKVKDMNIIWKSIGGYKSGFATTKSGLKACIVEVQRSTSGRSLYSLCIEGEMSNRNVATRATLEKINQILESR